MNGDTHDKHPPIATPPSLPAVKKTKQLVVLSGLAGAGKSTAAKALEDLGFFVVDNLPIQLIETLVNLAEGTGEHIDKIALVIDAREGAFLQGFGVIWDRLKQIYPDLRLLFLTCSDDILVKRYQETRRRHPLDKGSGIQESISEERRMLDELQHRADEIIDTRTLSVHQLKQLMFDRFTGANQTTMRLTISSFGFKYGLPHDVDMCFDARFLPNPFFVEELRPLTGLEPSVAAYVLSQTDSEAFLQKLTDLLHYLLPRYHQEGKAYLTVGIGCTGGRHRSPALAEELAKRLRDIPYPITTKHRDIGR